jgi:hypothetical protein
VTIIFSTLLLSQMTTFITSGHHHGAEMWAIAQAIEQGHVIERVTMPRRVTMLEPMARASGWTSSGPVPPVVLRNMQLVNQVWSLYVIAEPDHPTIRYAIQAFVDQKRELFAVTALYPELELDPVHQRYELWLYSPHQKKWFEYDGQWTAIEDAPSTPTGIYGILGTSIINSETRAVITRWFSQK